jgi:nucleoside-diphosphate-sugar epimerase
LKILITGTSGHLGEALVRSLQDTAHELVGLDRVASPYTNRVGSVTDRTLVKRCVRSVDAVIHTATLHKPHMATHARQDFVDTNVSGTLNLLEESAAAGVSAFAYTSTTSVFGRALTPPPGAPAVWVTEDLRPLPKNIYGVTKSTAEDLCEVMHDRYGLPCLILRTSRFFPEMDDDASLRLNYDDGNIKANEYLYRRVDLQDVVDAHLLAVEKAPLIGFGRYIISATTPFTRDDATDLRGNAPRVVGQRVPEYTEEYARRGWTMFPEIARIYVNDLAQRELGWLPKYDFRRMIASLRNGDDPSSPLSRAVGSKGYHDRRFAEGPYPVA